MLLKELKERKTLILMTLNTRLLNKVSKDWEERRE